MFQPTPAIADGRDSARCRRSLAVRCFNPRPPLLTGETCETLACAGCYRGFNPRPPLLTGETWRPAPPAPRCRFQPTPAIADGRDLADAYHPSPTGVSTHARHC